MFFIIWWVDKTHKNIIINFKKKKVYGRLYFPVEKKAIMVLGFDFHNMMKLKQNLNEIGKWDHWSQFKWIKDIDFDNKAKLNQNPDEKLVVNWDPRSQFWWIRVTSTVGKNWIKILMKLAINWDHWSQYRWIRDKLRSPGGWFLVIN